MAGANIDIPKVNGVYDRKTLQEKLKTLKTSLPDQTAITVQPEDSVAYADLVETVDTAMGEQLRNVTVAPAN
jgi:biopolymer transport protein TolR